MRINGKQKIVLIIVAMIILSMLLFPPLVFRKAGVYFDCGHDFLFYIRKGNYPFPSCMVNESQLFIQWIGVLILGCLAFFLTSDKRDK